MPPAERRLLLSCEHGGNRVPRPYQPLFAGKQALLASHRGWDPGALAAARTLARALGAELFAATTTRLLVDLNRSPKNPAVFSAPAAVHLPLERREELLAQVHRPHWDRIRAGIGAGTGRCVVHVGVHSFTPALRGERREFEVGILYDPQRQRERAFAVAWQQRLHRLLPELRVRRNAPYRGNTDGLTTALRQEFAPGRYLGLELELNQHLLRRATEWRTLTSALATTLREELGQG